MQMNASSIVNQKAEWEKLGVKLPAFDHAAMTAATKEHPIWVHFGAGNIFRGFIAALQQRLLNEGLADRGIIAADTFDYDIIDKIYTPYDNLTMNVTLNPDGTTSREIIRNYFLNDFIKDHIKTYQKRPIYWLFDSGKKNGFKALCYMHRYQRDLLARLRTDYVHEQQARYRTAIEDLEKQVAAATSTSERVKLTKQLNKVQAQDTELHQYEEKVHALADQMIKIDLDDGVKHNYEIFKDVLAKIK